ncbi:hypothetical protein NDU88_008883 [Pleurodeles waltl]|uniref:Reverse transcriptase zinc-binding domain-containing protein n=1 Tax=Pleurodeles waltl TaxID=8319 RepID=A0AAV7QS01_PLEWA|nr:hypothetical protein NDU88_008883 [Pleurodeles waltl]
MQDQRAAFAVSANVKWEADVGMAISDETWKKCCAHMRALSPNYRLRLINFTFLQRLYYTPWGLCAMGLQTDASCEKCHAPDDDFFHLAWQCGEVHDFWLEVAHVIGEMTGLKLALSPVLALLGSVDPMPPAQQKLVGMLLLLVMRRVAICWGRGRCAWVTVWLRDAAYCREQLETFWELAPEGSRPRDIWVPLREYLETAY